MRARFDEGVAQHQTALAVLQASESFVPFEMMRDCDLVPLEMVRDCDLRRFAGGTSVSLDSSPSTAPSLGMLWVEVGRDEGLPSIPDHQRVKC